MNNLTHCRLLRWTSCAILINFAILASTVTLKAQVSPNWTDRFTFVSIGAVGLIQTAKSDGSGLTSLGNGENPVWSPNGQKLAYLDRLNCNPRCLAVVNWDGTGRTTVPLSGFSAFGSHSWFPDSQRLAFVGVTTNATTGASDFDIYAVNSNGSNLVRLTNTPTLLKEYAKVSPDGSRIVYRNSSSSGVQGVYLVNSDGTGDRLLTAPSSSDYWIDSGEWSPDSTKLARTCSERVLVDPLRNVYRIFSSICLIDLAGGRTNITEATKEDYVPETGGSTYRESISSPAWSNDGSRLLYTKSSERFENSAWIFEGTSVLETSVEGGGSTEIFRSNGGASIPAYSPDDRLIAFYDSSQQAILVLKDGTGGDRTYFRDLHSFNGFERISWRPRSPCDCQAIPRPQTQAIQTNWDPVDGVDINWKMTAEVSDDDGLVLKDVALGNRFLAKKISLPYVEIATSGLPLLRTELLPNGNQSNARTRLAKYEVFSDSEKLVIEATYVLDNVPNGNSSCVHIIQRYEFYRQGFGGKCEPNEALYCSIWRPIVKYRYFGIGNPLTTITIPQRREIAVDNEPRNTIAIFKDCDTIGPRCLDDGIYDFAFANRKNPLFNEISERVASEGKSTNTWDNIHQTNNSLMVDEPSFCPLCLPTGGYLIEPGCAECMHNHWRWSKAFGEPFGNGEILDIPKGSRQDLDVAIVRQRPEEEDPSSFRSLFDNELIRTNIDPATLRVLDIPKPESVVTWYVGTGKQSSDEFFRFPIFYSASKSVYKFWDGLFNIASLSSTDDLASITAQNFYHNGETTVQNFDVAALDPTAFDPIPIGYEVYGDLARDIQTEAEASGPFVTTFGVPSAVDQTDFNKLRILHAEQDPFDPNRVRWVDRTIMPPQVPAPDFDSKTVSASTSHLGAFVVARRETIPPPNSNVADIGVSAMHSPSQVSAGSELTFTLNVSNNSSTQATNARLISSLPAGARYISATSSQGTCKQTQGAVVCKLGTIDPGSSMVVSLTVRPSDLGGPVAPNTKTISNATWVLADETDPNYSNNTSIENVVVMPGGFNRPQVQLLTPMSGTTLSGPAVEFKLTAAATDSDGTIDKVDFLANGELIGTATAPTEGKYVFDWTGVGYGEHSIIAIATDNLGKSAISNVANVFVNGPASVAITSPSTDAQFRAPASLTLGANASYASGSITKLAFYANGVLVGNATQVGSGQYSFNWSGITSGQYSLIAVAADNNGILTKSNAIPISVYLEANRPPQIGIISPSSGTRAIAPATVIMTANASDLDGNVTRVEFYSNGGFIGLGALTGSNQYSFTWSGVPDGNYNLTASAKDDKGAYSVSDPVTFIVDTTALFVTGSSNLTAADLAVKTRLQNLGFTVTVKDHSTAVRGDATGKSVVVISSTASANVLTSTFRYVTVPVVTWNSALFPGMGMTTYNNKDFGTTNRQTQIQIISPSHQLAGGLSGTVTVFNSNDLVSWGKPNANAVKVATVVGDPTKIAIFGYSTGALMPFLNAPARRVGLYMSNASATNQNSNGWTLFDSAINWAVR